MKKIIFAIIVFGAAIALGAQTAGSTLYVSVRNVDVKSSSGFFADRLGTLSLGDAVTVQQNQGKWLVVRGASGLQGWVPADAFSARRILPAGASVSASEFAMAGKGFTEDLEKIMNASGERDYSAVDAMERRSVSPGELRTFLREGRLSEGD